MSSTEMNRFAADIVSDKTLQAKFEGVATIDQAVEIARAAGYLIDAEDLSHSTLAAAGDSPVELSESELEAVAGGGMPGFNEFVGLGLPHWLTDWAMERYLAETAPG